MQKARYPDLDRRTFNSHPDVTFISQIHDIIQLAGWPTNPVSCRYQYTIQVEGLPGMRPFPVRTDFHRRLIAIAQQSMRRHV